jgi:hypothetical protein
MLELTFDDLFVGRFLIFFIGFIIVELLSFIIEDDLVKIWDSAKAV